METGRRFRVLLFPPQVIMDCPQAQHVLSFLRAVKVARPVHLQQTCSERFCGPSPTAVNRFSPNSRRESSTDCPSVLRHAGNLGNNYIWESPVGTPEERPYFCTKPGEGSFSPRQFCFGVWLEIRRKDQKGEERICISVKKGQSPRKVVFCPDTSI